MRTLRKEFVEVKGDELVSSDGKSKTSFPDMVELHVSDHERDLGITGAAESIYWIMRKPELWDRIVDKTIVKRLVRLKKSMGESWPPVRRIRVQISTIRPGRLVHVPVEISTIRPA